MRCLILSIMVMLVSGYPSVAQETLSQCGGMAYANRNQVDYGPLKVARVRGTAKDKDGVVVPGVCVGIFTPEDHKLVMATQTDSEGRYEFVGVPKGEYRLVATYARFFVANAKMLVRPGSRNKKRLDLLVRLEGLHIGSEFELK